MNNSQDQSGTEDRAYPLVALVSLLTSCVAIAVCIDGTALLNEVNKHADQWPQILMAIGCIAGVGALFGAVIGLGHVCRWRAVAICGVSGIVVGCITFAVYVSPAPLAPSIAALFMPVAVVVIFRVFSD